jgi:hypothetical protein
MQPPMMRKPPNMATQADKGAGFAFGTQLPGYVPGQRPNIYSNGIAQRIPPNSDLVVQLHYAPTTSDEPDSSSFNLFFLISQLQDMSNQR